MGKGGENTVLQQQSIKPGIDDFVWSPSDEPHASRRKQILAKHPEIKQLYGHCPWLRYKMAGVIALQFSLAYYFRHQFSSTQDHPSWWVFWVTAYAIGGTFNHLCMMALHELSHNLGFKKMQHNRMFAILCNIPIGVPAAVSFKRYHMDHHKYQGVDGIDMDIPTMVEGHFFNNTFKKFFFLVFQVAFYALRPGLVNPKAPGLPELINTVVVVSVDAALVYFWGLGALVYWLVGSWLGMGLHPVAGHFIAEHYVFSAESSTQETYSYYGPCNYFTFNVGYHNEHHDFPYVPGSRLPQVYEMAKEFYKPLPAHASYCKVLWDYITNPQVTAFSRVKRSKTGPDEGGVVADDHAFDAVTKKTE